MPAVRFDASNIFSPTATQWNDQVKRLGIGPGNGPSAGLGPTITPGGIPGTTAPGVINPALPPGISEAIKRLTAAASSGSTSGLEDLSRTNIEGLLTGQLPPDVTRMLTQGAAERGVAGGFAGSPNDTAAYLRALGLTTLDVQQKGEEGLAKRVAEDLQRQSLAQQASLEAARLAQDRELENQRVAEQKRQADLNAQLERERQAQQQQQLQMQQQQQTFTQERERDRMLDSYYVDYWANGMPQKRKISRYITPDGRIYTKEG